MSTEPGDAPPRRYLIATAVADYRDPAWSLPDLDEARRQIVEVFTHRLGYEHVSTLGLNPTKDQLRSALRTFCRAADRRPDDLLAVYITGHGQVLDNARHVLLATDTDPADVGFSALPTAELAEVMLSETGIRRVLLMLDVCYAEQGGNHLAANALETLDAAWSRDPGSGLVVVSAARPHQPARAGLFPRLLADAVEALPVAGRSPEHLAVDALVARMNAHKDLPGWQRIGLTMVGLDGQAPPFFTNPRHDPGLTGVDLAIQEAHHRERVNRIREQGYTATMLVKAMAYPSNSALPEWWFRGRRAALEELASWMRSTDPCRVVTAGPGSGKTALLGLIATITHPKRRPTAPFAVLDLAPDLFPKTLDAVVYAQHLTDSDVIEALAAAAHVTADSVGSLLEALGRGDRHPFTVIIDGLDEAATPESLCGGLLRHLIEHSDGRIRLLLGTRPYLLEHLGVDPDRVVDLDTERFADRPAIAEYAVQTLLKANAASPYRGCPAAKASAVADAIAEAAGTSFLVARIVAGTLAAAEEAVADPQDTAWRQSLPRHAGQAMHEDLERRLGPDAQRAVDLLRPLAFAKGEGLPWENLWAPLASAISGRAYTDEDILWLRRTAGSYVVEDVDGDRSAYRIYHQALSDHLTADVDEPAVHSAFVDVLAHSVPYSADASRNWSLAHPYALRHLGWHAALADRLDELLNDTEFLVHAEPRALNPHLGQVSTEAARLRVAVYRTSIHEHAICGPAARRLILAIDAARAGAADLRERLVARIPSGAWIPHRATGAAFSHATLDVLPELESDVTTTAITSVDGELVVVFGNGHRINTWNVRNGKAHLPEISPPEYHSGGFAIATVHGGPAIVAPGASGSLRIWCLRTGRSLKGLVTDSPWCRVLSATDVDGVPVVIAATGHNRTAIWNLDTGEPFGPSLQRQSYDVAAAVTLIDDVPTAVVVGDNALTIWNLRTGRAERKHVDAPAMVAVACTVIAGEPVAVGACADHTLRVWSLRDFRQIGKPLSGHTKSITAIACYEAAGNAMAVTTSYDMDVRIWNLSSSTGESSRLIGHTSQILTVSCGLMDGMPIAASGGADCRVRLWKLPLQAEVRQQATAHGYITGLAYRRVDGIPVAATLSIDGWTTIWDVDQRRALVESYDNHRVNGDGVDLVEIDGVPHAVVNLGTGLKLWNLRTQESRMLTTGIDPPYICGMTCTRLDNAPVAFVAIEDEGPELWNLNTGDTTCRSQVHYPDHDEALASLATGDGVIVFGVDDTKGYVWDLRSDTLRSFPVGSSTRSYTVASVNVDGVPIGVTCAEGVIETWNLSSGKAHRGPLSAGGDYIAYLTAGTIDGAPTAASTDLDTHLRLWNLRTGQRTETIHLPRPGPLALTEENEIVVALGSDVVILRRKPQADR